MFDKLSKDEKKQLRRMVEKRERRREALEMGRDITEDIALDGIGVLVAQLMQLPSFENGICWDFRMGSDGLGVYKSVVVPHQDIILPGYKKAQLTPEIREHFLVLETMRIPAVCRRTPLSMLDGTSYRLALFGSNSHSMTLTWSSRPQAEWLELVEWSRIMLANLAEVELVEVEV